MYIPAVMSKPPQFSESFVEACHALDSPEDRWTDLRLAVFLNTTPTQIWRWRNGKATPHELTQEGILKRLRDEARKQKRPKPG